MIGDVQDDTKEQIDGFADVALQLSDRLGQVMKQQQALSFDSEKQNHAIQQKMDSFRGVLHSHHQGSLALQADLENKLREIQEASSSVAENAREQIIRDMVSNCALTSNRYDQI